jgi:hypothetical protein
VESGVPTRVDGAGGAWPARLRRRAPALFYTLVFWLSAEALGVLLLPVIVPRHVALSWYLGPEAREATRIFLEDRHPFLLYDPLTGWRNRPGCGQGDWHIDRLGSRSTHALGVSKSRPHRLLCLGNSLVNGAFEVTDHETISAYCEDSLTEAGNFATMLYSLDQVVLAYQGGLDRFGADVVVVGLPTLPGNGLTARYVPFLQRSQVRMPYFKPRLVLEGDSLRLVPVPSRERWRRMLVSSAVLDTLVRDDACVGEFESYRRFGLTPIAAGLRQVLTRSRNLLRRVRGDMEDMPLARRLMHELVLAAARHDARVIFVVLPQRQEAFPTGWRRYLPDHYGKMVAGLRREGFALLDAREVLRASGLPPRSLYNRDGNHLRPVANRLVAARLREAMAALWPTAPLTQRRPRPGAAGVRVRGRGPGA